MAKNTTEGLYQAVIDNVASLLAAVKGEAKANKRLGNSVARLERLEKTLPGFQSKYVKITTAAKEEPEATKKAAAKPATAKKGKTAAKAKPAAKAEPATEAKKPAKAKAKKAKPAPEVIPDIEEAPEEATLN